MPLYVHPTGRNLASGHGLLSPFRCGSRALAVAATLFAGMRGNASDAAEPSPAPATVALAKIPTTGWHYARSGSTEVLSRLSARETKLYFNDFLDFQNLVRMHFPEASFPADWPLFVVLADSTRTFQAFGGEEFRTSGVVPGSSRFILVDGAESHAIEQSMRRRYVALAFDQHPEGRYPLWRQFGTRELLARVHIGRERLEIGSLTPYAFLPAPMIDLRRMLEMTRESPEAALQPHGASGPAYHQAMMFMHMCLFGTERSYRDLREPYARFTARLEREPLTEELFYECFGMDYAEMHALLRGYMNRGRAPRFEVRRHRFIPTEPVTVRAAAPEEVLLALEGSQLLRSPDAVAGIGP